MKKYCFWYKYTSLLSFLLLSVLFSKAQSFTVHICLKDSITQKQIIAASVLNLSEQKNYLSKQNGCVSITAQPKQMLAISAFGYYIDTITLTANNTEKTIWLKPIPTSLPSLTVYSKYTYNAYQKDSISRRDDFFKQLGSTPLTTFSSSNTGAGIGFNIDRFYGREKRKRKAIAVFTAAEQQQYINYRFNINTIGHYIKSLTGEQFDEFMQTYRPTYQWLREHTLEEDLIYYVNESLKKFTKK